MTTTTLTPTGRVHTLAASARNVTKTYGSGTTAVATRVVTAAHDRSAHRHDDLKETHVRAYQRTRR